MEHVMAEVNINVIVKRCKFSFSFHKGAVPYGVIWSLYQSRSLNL
jgi:hypothetical protein